MSASVAVSIWQAGDAAEAWSTAAAPGSQSALVADGGALRFEFTLAGHGACPRSWLSACSRPGPAVRRPG